MTKHRKFLPLYVLPLLLSGCHVKEYSVSGSTSINTQTGATTVTVTGTVTIVPHIIVGNVDPTDLASLASSGLTFSTSQNSQNFSPDNSTSPLVTLIATDGYGYRNTVTVPLQPVSAAIPPVNSGDAVYSYGIVENSALDSWAQSVAQNAQGFVGVNAVGTLPFVSAQNPGTYIVTNQITSLVTSPSSLVSASYDVPSNSGCTGRPHCYNPGP